MVNINIMKHGVFFSAIMALALVASLTLNVSADESDNCFVQNALKEMRDGSDSRPLIMTVTAILDKRLQWLGSKDELGIFEKTWPNLMTDKDLRILSIVLSDLHGRTKALGEDTRLEKHVTLMVALASGKYNSDTIADLVEDLHVRLKALEYKKEK